MNSSILKLALTLLQILSICQLSLSSTSSATTPSIGSQAQERTSTATKLTSDLDKALEITPPTFKLSTKQLADYKRDGYVIIRGLLSGKELKNAIRTARKLNHLSLAQRLYNIMTSSGYRKYLFQTWRKHKSMEHVAFDSPIPSIVAQAMGYANFDKDERSSSSKVLPSIRLIKEVYFAYEDKGEGCGWHVDDKYVWPCEDSPLNTPDAGVNVWITLSPIKASEGGGLAIAPTTHSIPWREDARKVITTILKDRGAPGTCEMETLSPEFHNKFESLKKTFDMEPGDAIIHDRYIFHRTDKFKRERKLGFMKRSKLRISLRYMPAKATVYVFDWGASDQGFAEKGMKTGDAVEKGGEYFPQVWPTSLKKEREVKVKEEEIRATWARLISFVKAKTNKKRIPA